MSLVVQKVGGASFADPERIKGVAQRVLATGSGGRVCVVVSGTGSVAPAGGVRTRRPGAPGEDAAEGVCEAGE